MCELRRVSEATGAILCVKVDYSETGGIKSEKKNIRPMWVDL